MIVTMQKYSQHLDYLMLKSAFFWAIILFQVNILNINNL